ncbi:protein of unknown function (DUF305) [Pseudoduganella lurida]|uniref:DUF305 domain-containing protein n=3 Tax=Burkholderiales TaxID=80840 RepID=A0A562RJ63_9BURK|nr:DUF305 family protein family protein [Herbaspirillum sp. SJZ107]TWI69098.1 protein of unknown function (DUF305) [Pseudoduganella lurida]
MKPMYLLAACLWAGACAAQDMPFMPAHMHAHASTIASAAPPAFVASSAKPYAALADDAMAVMDDDMRRAPMNGDPGHDFVTMMIPHHQGAIDMAKAILVHGTDPELRNLAQGIIAEQQNEINVMRAWLQRHDAGTTTHTDKEVHATH